MKTEKLVQRSLLVILFLFMIIILGTSFTSMTHSGIAARSKITMIMIGLAGIIIFTLIFNIVYRFCVKADKNKYLTGIIAAFAVIIAGQLLMVKYINARPIEDLNLVTRMAVYLLSGSTFTEELSYFGMYTNNIPFTIYLSLIYKALLKIGIADYTLAGSLLGIFALDASLLFTALIINKMKGRTASLACVIVSAFNPAMYIWGMFFYTTIVAIMFLNCAVYIGMTLNSGSKPVIFFKFFCLGIVLFIGTQIRATTIFSLIALAICAFAAAPSIYKSIRSEKRYRYIFTYLIGAALCLAAVLICKNTYSILENKYIEADYSDQEFPPTHWIMMGLAGSGSYNYEDEMQTLSLPTKQEKLDFTKAEIKRRIEELKLNGLVKLAYEKIKYTWSDGTNDYPVILRASNHYTSFNKFVLGDKREPAIIYFQIFHVVLIWFAILGIVYLFLYSKSIFEALPAVVLLGGIGFHIIWEANPKYSLNFMFCLVYLSILGMFFLFEQIKKFNKNQIVKYTYNVLMAAGVILSVIILIVMYKPFTKEVGQLSDTVSGQIVNSSDSIEDFYNKNEALVQTFSADRSFNTVSIFMGNPNQSTDTVYKFELLDELGNVLSSSEIDGKSNTETKKILDIYVGDIKSENKAEYSIQITPVLSDAENKLLFYFDSYDDYDLYYDGELIYNNQSIGRDLGFSVSRVYNGSIMSSKLYIILALIFITFEVCLCLLVNRKEDKHT